jgi:lysozyme
MSLQLDMALSLVKEAEGFEPMPYYCPAGKITQGFGRNLEAHPLNVEEMNELNADGSVGEYVAAKWVLHELLDCEIKLMDNIIYNNQSPVRKAVLLDMCFNIGYAGLMKFKKMWFALGNKDYPEASRQMKDSSWYLQVGKRSKRNVEIMASNTVNRF